MPVQFPHDILGRPMLRQGFSYQRQPAVERTQMDSGLARGRLYNANPLARVPCRYGWNEAQIAFWEAWLQTKANRGSTWFEVDLPLEGGTYRTVLARVVGEPKRIPDGANRMTVDVEFEIHDALILPDGIVDLILEFGPTGVQETAAAVADLSLQPYFDGWSVGFGA